MALSGSLNFLTASSYGAGVNGALTLDGDNTDSKASFTAIDFAGLNTIIREPMTASQNYLGQPMDVPMLVDVGVGPTQPVGHDLNVPGNYVSLYRLHIKPPGVRYADPTIFNALMLHRNGPYQHPSWKQYRGGEHPVARTLRLNNTMSIDFTFADSIAREEHKKQLRYKLENGTHQEVNDYFEGTNNILGTSIKNPRLYQQPNLQQYYEPSVLKAHKPFIYDVQGAYKVRSTLMNQMVFFENKEINQALNIAGPDRYSSSFSTTKKPKQEYYDFISVAKENGASGFIYSETIFPKSVNTFRPYKLEKLKYEETSGLSSNGYDRTENRSFWRDLQPPLGVMIGSNGTSRIRTDGAAQTEPGTSQAGTGFGARNSQSNTTRFPAIAPSAAGINSIGEQKTGLPVEKDLVGSYDLISSRYPIGWNFTYNFMDPGVIVHTGNNMSSSVNASNKLPARGPTASFVTLESYQPHPISLLSMWPLDPRPDIYDKPIYLTSSVGGQGLQIGLTPHRMMEYQRHDVYAQSQSPVFTSSIPAAVGPLVHITGSGVGANNGTYADVHWPNGNSFTYSARTTASASYGQIQNLMTGTAGELVYSTKTPMFFHKTGSEDNDIKGYRTVAASMQYNRHTFPYNTPFYATNRVRGRNPFYNSYSDFSENMKYLGRDYSIIPEYKTANNIQHYYENYFKGRLEEELHVESELSFFDVGDAGSFNGIDSFYDSLASQDLDATGDAMTDPAFSAISKASIIKRKILFSSSPQKAEDFKLNFLTIDGAFVTSSANVKNLSGLSESALAFKYDPLTNNTSISTLQNELGYSSEKTQISYLQNSSSVIFDEAFSKADTGASSNIIGAPFEDGPDTIPSAITFTAHGLKKLRPEKNFYPVTKTLDVGNKFYNFIYNSLDNENGSSRTLPEYSYASATPFRALDDITGTPDAVQAFLEPFFAPGILYNSIKSGIAVDYPVYTTKPAYFTPYAYFSGSHEGPHGSTVHTQKAYMIKDYTKYGGTNTGDRFTGKITSSFNYGGFHMVGASRCIPAILTTPPDFRMPFEALYDTSIIKKQFNSGEGDEGKLIYLTTEFVDLDINFPMAAAVTKSAGNHSGNTDEHPGAAHIPTGPRAGLKIDSVDTTEQFLYESSINNFLCETMNFFLEDQGRPGHKLPVLVSDYRKDSEIDLKANKQFAMDVTLAMGVDQVMCEGPRDAGIGGGTMTSSYANYRQSTKKMRGYLYGPPVEIVRMSGDSTILSSEVYDEDTDTIIRTQPKISADMNSSGVYTGKANYEAYFGANLTDPAYQTYTPPYFYGKSSLMVTALGTSNLTTWDNIADSIDDNSYYLDSYITGANYNEPLLIQKTLCNHLPGVGSTSGFSSTRMKIDSSVDTMNRARINYDEGTDEPIVASSYYVNPKWICPVLDFSSSYAAVSSRKLQGIDNEEEEVISFVNNSFHDITTGRGLWGGYGSDPYDNVTQQKIQALTGEATTGPNTIQKGLVLSVRDAVASKQWKQTSATYNTSVETPTSGFFVNKNSATEAALTGSLADALGMPKETVSIGKMADSKTVSEALVVIPYFDKPVKLRGNVKVPSSEIFITREIIPGKHFLPIHKMLFENLLSMALAKRKYGVDKIVGGLGNKVTGPTTVGQFVGYEDMDSYNAAAKTDAFKMIETILGNEAEGIPGYELPVELDFINYKEAHYTPHGGPGPFQMIVLPFEHELTKQELMDIYQGVMPDSSLSFKKAVSSFSLDLKPNTRHTWMPKTKGHEGFFGDQNGVSLAGMNAANFLDPSYLYDEKIRKYAVEQDLGAEWIRTSRDFYKNLKFMTFKIKQRAQKDYQNYKNRQIEEAVFQKASLRMVGTKHFAKRHLNLGFDTTLRLKDRLGYNWPYDDFSLVEAVKLDIKLEVED